VAQLASTTQTNALGHVRTAQGSPQLGRFDAGGGTAAQLANSRAATKRRFTRGTVATKGIKRHDAKNAMA
jgi:hypothetical protein